ncbi:MAG: TIGR02678 family protein [Ktedonobacteraceae bacterium]|nr:TIGR02678 family protein [Ktedonobacteraceae bacterium]
MIQAHVALLDHEIVSLQIEPESFRQIRIHYTTLVRWHETHTGWRIQRGSTFFRLERHLHAAVPVVLDAHLKKPRDFACLVWVLWFAEKRYLTGGGRNQQFLLSQLAADVQEQSNAVCGSERQLDFRNQQDRYSIWRSLEYLAHLGGLRSLEGEIKRWVDNAEQLDNEVLYEFTDIAHSFVEALQEQHISALAAHTQPLGSTFVAALGQSIPPLHRAWRTLLLGPLLLRYDDAEAFSALTQQADTVSEGLAEAFGWLLELNCDYACIVRSESLSSASGPGFLLTSAHDQIILLLCSAFRQQVVEGSWNPDAYGCVRVTQWEVANIFGDLRQHYGSFWGATVQHLQAIDLLEELYRKMRQIGLLRGPDSEGELLILPTVARYAVSYAQEPDSDRAHQQRTRSREKSTERPMTQENFGWANLEHINETEQNERREDI